MYAVGFGLVGVRLALLVLSQSAVFGATKNEKGSAQSWRDVCVRPGGSCVHSDGWRYTRS